MKRCELPTLRGTLQRGGARGPQDCACFLRLNSRRPTTIEEPLSREVTGAVGGGNCVLRRVLATVFSHGQDPEPTFRAGSQTGHRGRQVPPCGRRSSSIWICIAGLRLAKYGLRRSPLLKQSRVRRALRVPPQSARALAVTQLVPPPHSTFPRMISSKHLAGSTDASAPRQRRLRLAAGQALGPLWLEAILPCAASTQGEVSATASPPSGAIGSSCPARSSSIFLCASSNAALASCNSSLTP